MATKAHSAAVRGLTLSSAGVIFLSLCTGLATARATTPVTLAVTVTEGAVSQATVVAYPVNPDGSNGAALATAITDGTGAAALTLPAPSSQPVRLIATGGSFLSEQNGAKIVPQGQLTLLLPGVSASPSAVSVNPLTTFIDTLTVGELQTGSVVVSDAMKQATATIEADYGLTVNPALLTPAFGASQIGRPDGAMGLILGALTNEDQQLCPAHPGGLVAALASDIADGVFDGANDGVPVHYCGTVLAPDAGTSEFEDALSGAQQFEFVSAGFIFGGRNNALSGRDVAADQLLAPLASLNSAIGAAAPAAVDAFAPVAATPVMLTARANATATLLRDGTVLVAGGFNSTDGYLNSTEIYHPASNTFTAGPAMNIARADATATALANGKVLIAGGFNDAGDNNNYLVSTELYDPVAAAFAAAPPVMNVGRENAVALALPNGKVLIAGGVGAPIGGNPFLASTELYDPASASFAPTSPAMNFARAYAAGVLLPNGQALIAGGSSFNLDIELYDPVTNSFASSTPALSTFAEYPTATLLPNGEVLIAGGLDGANGVTATNLYLPASDTFASSAPVLHESRYGGTAVLLPNGKVLLAGGYSPGQNVNLFLKVTEVYDPATNSLSATPPSLNTARGFPTATLLRNGQVLLAGGYYVNSQRETVFLNSTELYTP